MKTPKHWQRAEESVETPSGRRWLVSAWGWSDESEEAAAACARARLAAQAKALAAGLPLTRYAYQAGPRPLREEVLERPCEGSVVTRNAYGARVLNTERVAFVDVDLPPPEEPGLFARLFRGAKGRSRQQTLAETLELLRSALRPERLCARVYETRAGLRLLLTDRLFEPGSEATGKLLAGLGCDPLYLKLCQQQECFRARLTPKPWRCDLPTPPFRWPYPDAASERSAEAWVERYEATSAAFATTAFLTTLGAAEVHEAVRPVLDLHDASSGARTGRPLA